MSKIQVGARIYEGGPDKFATIIKVGHRYKNGQVLCWVRRDDGTIRKNRSVGEYSIVEEAQ